MKQDGLTLVEVIVVVSIISVLVVALGFQFQGWMARYNVESQIKTMHIDLMTARQRAMQKNVQYLVQLPADNKSYLICEDANNDGICNAPLETTNSSISQALSKSGLRYQINSNLGGATIVMNTKGIVMLLTGGIISNIDNTALKNIWLLNPGTMAAYGPTATNMANEVDYDCISLSTMRIGLGKYNGATCNVK
jgi:prepilin-type N-terminal cleavage/methylation domain-containing protein